MSKMTKFYFIASYMLIIVVGVSSFRIDSMIGALSSAVLLVTIMNLNMVVCNHNSLIKKYNLDEVIL